MANKADILTVAIVFLALLVFFAILGVSFKEQGEMGPVRLQREVLVETMSSATPSKGKSKGKGNDDDDKDWAKHKARIGSGADPVIDGHGCQKKPRHEQPECIDKFCEARKTKAACLKEDDCGWAVFSTTTAGQDKGFCTAEQQDTAKHCCKPHFFTHDSKCDNCTEDPVSYEPSGGVCKSATGADLASCYPVSKDDKKHGSSK